jgi:hypothetical protein
MSKKDKRQIEMPIFRGIDQNKPLNLVFVACRNSGNSWELKKFEFPQFLEFL